MLQFSPPVSVSEPQRVELLEFAKAAAIEAGAQTLPFFRAETTVENKLEDGGFDPVTEADKAAELILRERIRATYPAHGICGEEFGLEEGNGLTWVIDPIDGTRAFMSGMLHWGLLLGLFDGERPLIGVMYQPYTGELWSGDGSSALFQRGDQTRALQTRNCQQISQAVLTTTSPRYFKGAEGERFPSARIASEALEVRRGLLYLRHARDGVCRSCDGWHLESLRYSGIDPHYRRRGWRRDDLCRRKSQSGRDRARVWQRATASARTRGAERLSLPILERAGGR